MDIFNALYILPSIVNKGKFFPISKPTINISCIILIKYLLLLLIKIYIVSIFIEFEKSKICRDCKIIIENNQFIEHCKTCNICITEMSFHCFWIGKCIGKKNKIFFYLFLFMSIILIIYLIFAFVTIPFFKENNIKP